MCLFFICMHTNTFKWDAFELTSDVGRLSPLCAPQFTLYIRYITLTDKYYTYQGNVLRNNRLAETFWKSTANTNSSTFNTQIEYDLYIDFMHTGITVTLNSESRLMEYFQYLLIIIK